MDEKSNDLVLEKIVRMPIKIGDFIRSVFVRASDIEKNVKDLLSYTDNSLSLMELNTYTLDFKDQKMQKIYDMESARPSLRYFRQIFTISLLFAIAYMILDVNLVEDSQYYRYEGEE